MGNLICENIFELNAYNLVIYFNYTDELIDLKLYAYYYK